MKIRKISDTPKASRIFTDREEPRAAFWSMYNKEASQMGSDEADVHVISYYGIGGIGKSRLLKQLRKEMDEKIAKPYYADIDFETCCECRDVLIRLKNKLADKYKFEFHLFELCCFVYAQKVGENPESPSVKGLIAKSPLLNTIVNTGGHIPYIDIVANVFSATDEAVALIRGKLHNDKKELYRLREMEIDELYKALPEYFAKDMLRNMQNMTQPLVVFFDTYERLVNELEQIGNPLQNDMWLRGINGIIPNIPGVLWVIAGREKLKWADLDSNWADSLEQHILGGLSPKDSDSFLSGAGVADKELREYIHNLTGGTPVYLDICVDRYEALIENGETPQKEMFGKNTDELLERFIRYMNDAQKDMVYMLVCLSRFSDSMILQKGAALLPGFSPTTYDKTKKLSFITLLDSGKYAFHQTVGEVLFKNVPETIRKTVGGKLIEIYKETFDSGNFLSDGYADALFYTARGGMALYTDREEFTKYYADYLSDKLTNFKTSELSKKTVEIIDMLLNEYREEQNDEFYLSLSTDKAKVLGNMGKYSEAYELQKEVFEKSKAVLGENHPDTLREMHNLAATLGELGRYDESCELQKEVFEKSKAVLGENHPSTLTAMGNMAVTLGALGRHTEANELQKEVLEKSKVVLGENHPDTLLAMNNLAYILVVLGRHTEANELQKEVLEKSKEVLGENHPDTLLAMSNLAVTLGALGRHTESYEMQKEVLEKRKAMLGENHPDTVTAMNNLAGALGSLGRHTESYELQKEVFEKRKAMLGENHPDTLLAMNNLAVTLGALGRHTESYEMKKEVLEKRKAMLGENHPDTVLSMNNLADTLSDMGEYGETFKIQKEVLEKRKEVLGENHPDTLLTMNNLASTLVALGRHTEAYELQKEVLEKQMAILGENHPDTLTCISNLALTLVHMGEHEEAYKLQKEVLEKRMAILGENHPDTLLAMNNLALTFYNVCMYEEAYELQKEVLEKSKVANGENHPDTSPAMNNLAVTLGALGRHTESYELQKEVLEKCKAMLGENHPNTLLAMSNLALTLGELGRHTEELDLLRELAEKQRKIYGKNSPEVKKQKKK